LEGALISSPECHPTAHGWNFVRSAEENGSWTVRKLQTLEEAVPLLAATDDFVLGLPVSAVLAQRFRLPSTDPAEFPEMIRIQIEKLLPFAADEVTTDFELIEQNENESVVSAVAVRNQQLAEVASPLLERGYIPRQVTVYAAQRASTHAPKGNAVLIYPEGETLVYAMTENGKLSLARAFEGGNGEQLQLELPQLRLSAELQGIDASSPNVLLDETCYEMRATVQGILASSTEIVGIELPPAPVKLNLLPESWRRRRLQLRRLRRVSLALAGVSWPVAFSNRVARPAHRARRARNRVRARDRSKVESAGAGNRSALFPGGNPAASFRQPARDRRADYCLQPVCPPNFGRW